MDTKPTKNRRGELAEQLRHAWRLRGYFASVSPADAVIMRRRMQWLLREAKRVGRVGVPLFGDYK